MLKKIKIGLLSFLVLGFLAGCQSGSKDVRDEARQNIEGANAVQPAVPSEAQPAVQEAAAPTGPTTVIEFAETTFDFGTVQDGEMVSHTYRFKNTGNEPLILSDAKGSCGCTVPKWPREPIAPGGSGEIVVEFNSKGKGGKRNQKVTLTANTNPPQTFIYLTGEVVGGDSGQPSIQVTQ
jgi:hypothetical protein